MLIGVEKESDPPLSGPVQHQALGRVVGQVSVIGCSPHRKGKAQMQPLELQEKQPLMLVRELEEK